MDFDLDSKLNEFDRLYSTMPNKVQYLIDSSKDSNTQALNKLNCIYRKWDEEIAISNSIHQADLEAISELGEKFQQLEKSSKNLKNRLDEVNLITEEKFKIAEKIIPPDTTQITNEKNKLEKEILMIKHALRLHINISKIKWDLSENKSLKGKILKENIAILH